MPNTNIISDLLEIKDISASKIENINNETHIYFTLKRRDHTCPHCGNITNKVHDYRTSIIKDSPISGKKTFLHYKKRRYHCDSCKKHFNESFPHIAKQCRISTRLCFQAIDMLKSQQSISSIAKQLGISPSTIFRRMNDVRFPKPNSLPLVLSIDEFRGNANGEKFQGILTDCKNKKIMDILPNRTKDGLWEYFRSFPNRKDVRYFVMDMNRAYKEIAEICFPNATIVIDRFHVVRYVLWALENVRKRVQKEMHPSKRKYFKRSRKILLSHFYKLNEENRNALEVMLNQSNDLAQAYYLKELFFDFMNSNNREEARKKIKKFMLCAETSQLEEFNACLTMLTNWGKYILNIFECPYSNGYTEGCNNKIKVIKRLAYGFRNFNNFRNRILLSS